MFPHGGVAIAGITTIGGNLLAGGDILPDDDGSRAVSYTHLTLPTIYSV